MRRNTPKRAALNREADKWRRRQIGLVGQCENCETDVREILTVHEILAGTAGRRLAFDKAFATLVLCGDCHPVVGKWCRARQLALLYLVRPGEYDLNAYNALSKPWIIQEEVDWWIRELTSIREDRS